MKEIAAPHAGFRTLCAMNKPARGGQTISFLVLLSTRQVSLDSIVDVLCGACPGVVAF